MTSYWAITSGNGSKSPAFIFHSVCCVAASNDIRGIKWGHLANYTPEPALKKKKLLFESERDKKNERI